ncbi:MAG: DoxX family protein [Porticoccaceae bacterium]|nr:DoxX family protein [Porticoccaceae bacterium]
MKNLNQDHAAFILRLALGSVLLSHGLLKILVFGVSGTVGYFASLGLPSVVAYLMIFGEITAGLAIISGVLTRLAASLSLPILIGATWAHLGNGWVFSSAGGGWEFPALLVVLALAISIQGAGSYALDQLISSRSTAASPQAV